MRLVASLALLLLLPAAAAAQEVSVSGFIGGTSALFDFLTSHASAAALRLEGLSASLAEFPSRIASFFAMLSETGFDPLRMLSTALPWLLLGAGSEYLFRRLSRRFRLGSRAGKLSQQVLKALLDFAGLAIFALIAGWPLLMSSQSDPVAQVLIVTYFSALIGIRGFAMLVRIPLAPFAPEIRIVALCDADAGRLYRWVVGIAALAMVFLVTAVLLADGGLGRDAVLIFTLASRSVVTALLILACLGNRRAIAAILARDPSGRSRGPGWRSFAALWHLFAIFYICLSWFSTSILLLLDRTGAGRTAADSFLLVMALIVTCLLIDDWAAGSEARDRARRAQAEGGAADAEDLPSFPQFFGRMGQSFAILAAILLLIRLWSGPWRLVRHDKVAAILPALVQLAITLTLAYVLWHLVVIGSERILRRAASPRDGDGPPRRDRVATLLPLLRNTILAMIVTITGLIGLSSIGVDVVPLLAGAGVIGLALGMGSQTLVRDVISGVFFLLDDAFRVGEYVNVGLAEGTIERAGVRSLQIRHYLGTLHTVPFGQIGTIANRSRGWVAMQLDFRLPLAAEPAALAEVFSQIGDALLADPENGPLLLEKPGFAGIVSIEDRFMVVRLVYKCLPGAQFGLRDATYRIARAHLAEAGFEFALPEFRLEALPGGTKSERN